MLRVFSGRRPARRRPSALARIGRFCARLTFVALALPTLVLLALRLPDVADNLEARMLLLQRRLQENCPHPHIEKTGRGRFRLCVLRPVVLEDA